MAYISPVNDQLFMKLFTVRNPKDWDSNKKELKNFILDILDREYNQIFWSLVKSLDENEIKEEEEKKEAIKKYIIGFFEGKKETNNFAYAWYRSQSQNQSVLFIATSIEMKDNLESRYDLSPMFDYFDTHYDIKFCVQRYATEFLPLNRLDENLEFFNYREFISAKDSDINMRRTCSERVIFDNLIWHFYRPRQLYEKPVIRTTDDLEIKLYTEKEPCLQCYSMMISLKNEYKNNLSLKVYYKYWLNEDMKLLARFNRQVEIFPEVPSEKALKSMASRQRQRGTIYEYERMPQYIEREKKQQQNQQQQKLKQQQKKQRQQEEREKNIEQQDSRARPQSKMKLLNILPTIIIPAFLLLRFRKK